MPNAAKLVAATGMAILAFIVSGMIMATIEEETNFGYFTYVNVILAFVVGWLVIGSRAGRGMISAINVGLTGPVVFVFWGLFIQASNEMTRLAMRNRYDNAFEALVEIFTIGAEYALVMATVPIWAALLIGGIVIGIATEFAWRAWK